MTGTKLRGLVVPAYLFLCLLMGGSTQGTWRTLVLQLTGIAIIGWAGMTRSPQPLSRAARSLLGLTAAAVLLVALQLVPLPPAIWTAFPGREPVLLGFKLLGQPLPWLPLSLTPYATIESLLFLMPSLAMLLGILRLGAYRATYLAYALLLATFAGIVLGAVQVSTGDGYLYKLATRGQASGFFANANYMGTLLLTAVPFVAALVIRKHEGRRASPSSAAGSLLIAGSLVAILIVGLGLSLSLAAVLLSLPVIGLSSLMLLRRRKAMPSGLAAVGVLAALLAVAGSNFLPAISSSGNTQSFDERQVIYRETVAAASDMMPAGSGFGSFPRIYAGREDPLSTTRWYTNHAHNDYLEIALEGGVVGILLILASTLR